MIRRYSFLGILLVMVLTSCEQKKEEEKSDVAGPVISEVKKQYAPDSRVALFDITAEEEGENLILKGESNLPLAVDELKQRLETEKGVTVIDSITLLPSKEMTGKSEGVIQISVANLRSKPAHSSELVTQATLGTPVKVYKKDDNWYYVQTPDGYLAWVDSGGVTPISEKDLQEWRSNEKIIFLEPFGFSYSKPSKDSDVVTDLVAGNILELTGEKNGFYEVLYPNKKKAYVVKSAAQLYKDWVADLDPSGENLTATAKKMMGVPYLWGGTSPKGVDCSGYTKTIFFLNGMVLPRDASQQIAAGEEVDSTRNFENLQPGDLLYFGRKATDSTSEKIIHVGMWIGDNQFIHSMGEVRISTFDTTSADFDEYNYNRYLRTKRVLGMEDKNIIQIANSDLFMATEKDTLKD